MLRFLRRVLIGGALIGIVLVVGGIVTVRSILTASLARESGVVMLGELTGDVVIERDAMGIPTIRGETYADVVRALGFVHGQERFFQMDLARRAASGELSELVGEAALDIDRHQRELRVRALADAVLEEMPAHHRRWLEAYSEGVNAGLEDLGARPPEYWALRTRPRPWRPADTMLVVSAMTQILSEESFTDRTRIGLAAALPRSVVSFLTPAYTRFDAPMTGDPVYEPAPIPGPEWIDLRSDESTSPAGSSLGMLRARDPRARGSNNWAVAGARTADGRAILASDPHLGYSVPGVWFRSQLEWVENQTLRRVVGVSIPGTPLIVIGSNGSVAWGPTNVHGDFTDYVVIDVDETDPSRYRTPDGSEPFEIVREVIQIRGAEPVVHEVKRTRWGPVMREDVQGRPLALKWTGADPRMSNLNLLEMASARTLQEGLDVMAAWWGPPQNVALADDQGRIAIVMSGYLPERAGLDEWLPASWAEPRVGWVGALEGDQRPRIVDPASGVVYSANARAYDAALCEPIGAIWPLGVRAGRIAEMLEEQETFDEPALMRMQLDTALPLLEAYRALLLEHVGADDSNRKVREAIETLRDEVLRADIDNRAVSIMSAFVDRVSRRLRELIEERVGEVVDDYRYGWYADDEWILRLLEEEPANWLESGSQSWGTWMRDRLIEAIEDQAVGGDEWGERSRFVFKHPLSMAVPALGPALDMPELPAPGHYSAVRAHSRSFGASMRMVVSPGREEDGLLHMPCGQSGHFLSKHYSDMHDDWAHGRPVPLLAGPVVSSFRLVPGQ